MDGRYDKIAINILTIVKIELRTKKMIARATELRIHFVCGDNISNSCS